MCVCFWVCVSQLTFHVLLLLLFVLFLIKYVYFVVVNFAFNCCLLHLLLVSSAHCVAFV